MKAWPNIGCVADEEECKVGTAQLLVYSLGRLK
jgi:hypothetical protein